MENTLIYQSLKRNSMPYLDIDYHIQILFCHPENQWFQPNNQLGQDFDVCKLLSELGLIEVMRSPVWLDGLFRGVRVSFKYNKNLLY